MSGTADSNGVRNLTPDQTKILRKLFNGYNKEQNYKDVVLFWANDNFQYYNSWGNVGFRKCWVFRPAGIWFIGNGGITFVGGMPAYDGFSNRAPQLVLLLFNKTFTQYKVRVV